MTIDKETLANSELTYHIIKELSDSSQTPTELSQGLETSSQSVNNYLKRLKELSVVKKEDKRGRKQPYRLKTEKFKEFLFELFEIYMNSVIDLESVEEVVESEIEMYNVFTPYEIDKALNRDIEVILFAFLDSYISFNDNSTINQMFEAFLDGVEMIDLDEYDIGWLYGLKAISKKRHNYTKDPEKLFMTALNTYQDFPDTIEKLNTYLLSLKDQDILLDVKTKPERRCPKCDVKLGKDIRLDIEGENECPECGQMFDKPNNVMIYLCPECGSEIKDPEHEEKTECGCGTLLNQAENEKEIQTLKENE